VNDHQTKLPCPICGGSSYTWGYVESADELKYKDKDPGFWQKHTTFGGKPLKARKCDACQNLQLFIKTEE